MKKLLVFFLLFHLTAIIPLGAQEIKGSSSEYNFNITKDPPKPPFLEIDPASVKLIDNDGNYAINANEKATLTFTLINTGIGDGFGLKLNILETAGTPGLSFEKSKLLETLKVGDSQTIEIPIQGNMNTINGKAVFQLSVEEPNGFDSDPVVVELATFAFSSPNLVIADYALQSSGCNRIQKRRPFDVQVLVQNTGKGDSEQSSLKIKIPENMFCLSNNEISDLGSIKSGETKTVTFNLVTNNDYISRSIPLKFEVTEHYKKYGESKEITLEINQEITTKELQIEAIANQTAISEITVATLTSAVDKNIPESTKKYSNRFALIIGNENYTDYQLGLSSEMNVDFARNDAVVFRQYCEKVMGIEDKNIFFITDGTAGKMNQEISKVVALLKRIGSNAELFFYYAGHGLPDESTHIPYLIPVDVSAANLSSAIKLGDLYNKLSETGAGRITVFLDACFTGGGRESGLLAARSVKVKPKEDLFFGNLVVFSASSGDQSSLPDQTEKHGIFTYFLLKKLQDSNGIVSYGDLAIYLKREVSIESIRKNSKEQDPTVLVSPQIENIWESWMLNP
jgi:hypothetical protein